MARLSKEARERLEAFKAVKVRHPHIKNVDIELSQAIEEHAGYSHLLLIGPGGVGKTTVVKLVSEQLFKEESDRSIVPVVVVKARPGDQGIYTRLDYYRQVLDQLREHAAVKDRLMNRALEQQRRGQTRRPSPTDWLDLREDVEYALERLGVKAVFIDEAQLLMQVQPPLKPIDQLNWLRSMTDWTNILHVLVGPYDLLDFRSLSGQTGRRGRDLHFPRYHVEKGMERDAFVGALRDLLEAIPLSCDINTLLVEHWQWFADATLGCIGILNDWLTDTAAAILAKGGTVLTREELAKHMLSEATRMSLELEARAGERKLADGHAKSVQDLAALLGKTGADHQSALPPPANQPTMAGPVEASSKPEPIQGERAPTRDPVGETITLQESRCPFAGALSLSGEQMRASGIFRVECPVCLMMRTLAPKGATVHFPTHNKRKTNRPHHEKRWVQREATWQLGQ